jgi:hypothetical protein
LVLVVLVLLVQVQTALKVLLHHLETSPQLVVVMVVAPATAATVALVVAAVPQMLVVQARQAKEIPVVLVRLAATKGRAVAVLEAQVQMLLAMYCPVVLVAQVSRR